MPVNNEKREIVLRNIFLIMFSIVMSGLFICSFLFSWHDLEIIPAGIEYVVRNSDNVAFNILSTCIVLILFYFSGKIIGNRISNKQLEIFAICISFLCFVTGIIWILISKVQPQHDQLAVFQIAKACNNEDFSSFSKGEYASNHRQQFGLITLLRLIFAVFKQEKIELFQYFTACTLFVLVYSGYCIIKILSPNNTKAQFLYLIVMFLCIPIYGYTPFVYGDLNSTAFVMLSTWTLLSLFSEFTWWKFLLLAISCGTMTQLRQNTIIVALAFGIIVLIKLLKQFVLGVAFAQMAVFSVYKPHLDPNTQGMPSALFIRMGLQDHGDPNRYGWFDFSNEGIFMESTYDAEIAKTIAYNDILGKIKKIILHPAYAFQFFFQKTNIQWNVPLYQCFSINHFFYDTPVSIAYNIYYKNGYAVLDNFMNYYQLAIYGGVLAFALVSLFKKKWLNIENHVLLIAVFGGFLFSLIWEAKARYVMPYFIMMIPYGVIGLFEIVNLIEDKLKTVKAKGN